VNYVDSNPFLFAVNLFVDAAILGRAKPMDLGSASRPSKSVRNSRAPD
jgi:hypothetical protein